MYHTLWSSYYDICIIYVRIYEYTWIKTGCYPSPVSPQQDWICHLCFLMFWRLSWREISAADMHPATSLIRKLYSRVLSYWGNVFLTLGKCFTWPSAEISRLSGNINDMSKGASTGKKKAIYLTRQWLGTRAGEPEPGVFGSLDPEPLEKKQGAGAGAAWKTGAGKN